MTRKVTYWCGLLGVLFFIIAAILGGFQFESYSHVSQFMSESYATGAPYGKHLRYFGFIPSGICLFLFGVFASRCLPKKPKIRTLFLLFAVFYGLGTVIVSIFPCDEGCNPEMIDPSLSQIIHNVMGGLTYLIVPISILFIGLKSSAWTNVKSYSRTTLIFGVIALLFTIVLFIDPQSEFIGLIQRIIEGTILLWVLFTCNYVNNLKQTSL